MLENEDGSDFLPMRLTTVLIVASLVLVGMAVQANEIVGQLSKAAAKDCALKIVAAAAAEYTDGCPVQGEGTIIAVTLPESVSRMTFGPVPAENLAADTGACSLHYTDGSDEQFLAGVPLGKGGPPEERGGPLILSPGRYSIRISTENVDGRLMALLYVEER
jgi:hypothetical protein